VGEAKVNDPSDLEAELREDVRLLERVLQERTGNCASSLV